MGCDSHFFLEKRVNKGPWQLDPGHNFYDTRVMDPVPIPSISGRDYYFFGILAGVRYSVLKPIAPNRGLPPDLSDTLRKAYKSEWYHSATFLTVKELERALNRYAKYTKSSEGPLDIEQHIDAPMEDAFKYSEDSSIALSRINNSVIKYIRFNLDWEKAENKLLGSKNKTEYRIILWFDS